MQGIDYREVCKKLHEAGLPDDPDVTRGEPVASIDARVAGAREQVLERIAANRKERQAEESASSADPNSAQIHPGDNVTIVGGKESGIDLDADAGPSGARAVVRIKDIDSGVLLGTTRGSVEAGSAPVITEDDYPGCYVRDPNALSDYSPEGVVAFVRFSLTEEMLDEARVVAIAAVSNTYAHGSAGSVLKQVFENASLALKDWMEEAYRVHVDPTKVYHLSHEKGEAVGRYGVDRMLSVFKYASLDEVKSIDVVKKSVIKLLEETSLAEQLAYPSLGEVVLFDVTEVRQPVPTSAFKGTYIRGVSFNAVYRRISLGADFD